jgi:hypothetical protein
VNFSFGGNWYGYNFLGTSTEKVNRWGSIAFDHFRSLYHSPYAAESGVQLVDTYQLFDVSETAVVPTWKDIVYNYQHLSNEDLRKMDLPANWVSGYKFGTFIVEQKYYMKYLTRRLTELGVVFIQQKLNGLQEILGSGKYDCVVNCSGLGAASVNGDDSVYPIRGQVLRVK